MGQDALLAQLYVEGIEPGIDFLELTLERPPVVGVQIVDTIKFVVVEELPLTGRIIEDGPVTICKGDPVSFHYEQLTPVPPPTILGVPTWVINHLGSTLLTWPSPPGGQSDVLSGFSSQLDSGAYTIEIRDAADEIMDSVI